MRQEVGMRIMRMKVVTISVAMALSIYGGSVFAQENFPMVHQYAALRGVLYTAEIGQAANRLAELDDNQLDSIVVALARTMNNAKTWNTGHPNWPRVVTVIGADLRKAVQESRNDSRWAQFKKAYQDTFELGLARSLTPAELQQLIGFYGSSTGQRYREAYNQMTKAVSLAMFELKVMMRKGQRLSELSEAERTDFSQLIGLFREEQATQWAIFDPGPGKDRSGLQAIPMMFTMAVHLRLPELTRVWHQLSENDRRSILTFRESDLGKRERQAVSEAARGLHPLFNEFGEPQGIGIIDRLKPFQAKWRALVEQ